MSGDAFARALTGAETGRTIRIFVYLQILDLLTTLVGLKMGLVEASPFVKLLMQFGPAAGLAGSKILAVGLACISIFLQKARLLKWINYWYATLVVWNLFVIILGQAGY
jgi:hypothetical protein